MLQLVALVLLVAVIAAAAPILKSRATLLLFGDLLFGLRVPGAGLPRQVPVLPPLDPMVDLLVHIRGHWNYIFYINIFIKKNHLYYTTFVLQTLHVCYLNLNKYYVI